MSISTLADVLSFLGVDSTGIFTINAANDVLVLTSDEGGPVNIDIPDGTYEGDDLATAIQTAMNADNTLTGTGTITFVVTYSSSTFKFTLDATAGKTIAYTHSGSDAGLTCGFNADHAAAQTITSNIAVPGSPADIVNTIWLGVEQGILNYCDVDSFNSTAYVHQLHSGNGSRTIRLKNWPLTVLSSVAFSTRPVLQIRNTSSDLTRALVNVDVADQELRLSVVGGANAGVSSPIDLTDSGSDTLAELITTINALGVGWDTTIYHSDFNDMLSVELMEVKGLVVGDIQVSSPAYELLYAPDTAIGGIDANENTGALYRDAGWPSGIRNVIVSYTAGYSTIPADLELAVLKLTKYFYTREQQNTTGIKSFSLSRLRIEYESGQKDATSSIPIDVLDVLDQKYKSGISL